MVPGSGICVETQVTDADRPQDAGRRHRKRGAPSAATSSLLARWHERLRDELEAVIVELTPATPPAGLLDVVLPAQAGAVRPSLERRRSLVELGAKIATALGSEVDPPAPDEGGPAARSRRRSRVDFG
jgi:hypothetical protein